MRPVGYVAGLGPVAVMAAIGQSVVLGNRPLPITTPDSASYVDAANNIVTHFAFVNPYRTPGYPVLLAVIQLVAGRGQFGAVVMAQVLFIFLAAAESYLVVYWLTRGRGWGALAAISISANLYLLVWERVVDAEVLSAWATTTTLLCVVLFVRRPRVASATLLASASIIAILVRPLFVLVPATIAAIMILQFAGRSRRGWSLAAAAAVSCYATLGLYSLANNAAFPGAGFTAVTNVNLYGKLLEYRLENSGDPHHYRQLRAATVAFLAKGQTNPYDFVTNGPPGNAQLVGREFSTAGAYAREAFASQPGYTVARSVEDAATIWTGARPIRILGEPRPGGLAMFALALVIYRLWLVLPLAPIVVVGSVWRKDDPLLQVTAITLGSAAVGLLTVATVGYTDFYRLLVTFDPFILVGGVLCIALLLKWRVTGLGARADESSGDPGGPSPPGVDAGTAVTLTRMQEHDPARGE